MTTRFDERVWTKVIIPTAVIFNGGIPCPVMILKDKEWKKCGEYLGAENLQRVSTDIGSCGVFICPDCGRLSLPSGNPDVIDRFLTLKELKREEDREKNKR